MTTLFHNLSKKVSLGLMSAAVLLGSLAIAPQSEGAAPSSTITHVLGTVQVRTRAGWRGSVTGTRLYPGMTLRTGKSSRTQLRYDDGSVVRLGSNSVLRVRNAQDLRLVKGKTWIKKQKSNQKVRVRTPVAHATVIGTELFVSHNEENISHVTTLTGIVEVENDRGEKTMVNPGEWVEIEPDKPLEKPTKFDWDELKKNERLLLDLDFVPTPDDSGEDNEDWK